MLAVSGGISDIESSLVGGGRDGLYEGQGRSSRLSEAGIG